ncbi:MAG TPA: hypothetical protein VGB61_01660 [Pyrinomonadaceae bacterium]
MPRFKLYIVVALAAFFNEVVFRPGVESARTGSRDFPARAIPHEQFDGNHASNFFPC